MAIHIFKVTLENYMTFLSQSFSGWVIIFTQTFAPRFEQTYIRQAVDCVSKFKGRIFHSLSGVVNQEMP